MRLRTTRATLSIPVERRSTRVSPILMAGSNTHPHHRLAGIILFRATNHKVTRTKVLVFLPIRDHINHPTTVRTFQQAETLLRVHHVDHITRMSETSTLEDLADPDHPMAGTLVTLVTFPVVTAENGPVAVAVVVVVTPLVPHHILTQIVFNSSSNLTSRPSRT